jgi:hypothetical protein
MMKHEWRKHEKKYYQPGPKPAYVDIPEFRFFSISGKGNPNNEHFAAYVGVLYSLSYAVRMAPKSNLAPVGYFEYTVYPLEGIWDITAEAKENYTGDLNKNDLVFKLMIRQPDFVEEAFAQEILKSTLEKKPNVLLEEVSFERIAEGPCIQMMHLGSYDLEPQSFQIMEQYMTETGYSRVSKKHHEIYISDPRKVPAEKLKTVLRFKVQ